MKLNPSIPLFRIHQRLLGQLDDMVDLARRDGILHTVAPSTSAWNVGQHLEHLLLADRKIFEIWKKIERGAMPSAEGNISFVGRIALFVGRIPRGRGRAPEALCPETVDGAGLVTGLEDMREEISELEKDLPIHETSSWRAPHPVFGPLSPTQWLRFIDIHHQHHLKIVQDIRRNAA